MRKPIANPGRPHLLCVMVVALAATWPASLFSAESPADSSLTLGAKHTTIHHVKGVVGPSVHIDDQGMISATWVEEDKDTRTILFARSKTPGGPLGTPVSVNQPAESPYYRQESPALIVHGQDIFVTWSKTHPKMTPDKPFSGELRLSRSSDGGRSFGPSTLVNDDDQVIQHRWCTAFRMDRRPGREEGAGHLRSAIDRPGPYDHEKLQSRRQYLRLLPDLDRDLC
jgi:hypothetical protein